MLVLQGLEEPSMPIENYEGIEKYMPDARLEFIDAGHFYVEENPRSTIEKVMQFFMTVS